MIALNYTDNMKKNTSCFLLFPADYPGFLFFNGPQPGVAVI